MKRSVQEIVELLVFGLIALLIGTGLLWLAGWIFDLVGVLFKFFAALIWSLLRFIVPVAVGAAIVYALVHLIQQQREKGAAKRATKHDSSAAANEPSTVESAPPPATASSAENAPPPPPARTPAGSGDGESHPTASEVWTPPQPAPPTQPTPPASSSETLEEPRPAEDRGPLDDPVAGERPGADTTPLDPAPADEKATGSVPADEEATGSVPAGDADRHDAPGEGRIGGSEAVEDEKRDS